MFTLRRARGAAWLLAPGTVTAVRACAARDSARSSTAYVQVMLRNAIALSFPALRAGPISRFDRTHRPCFSLRRETVGISPFRKNFTDHL
jgi:hypothetical protein